jgi:hypothetical protein
MMLMRSRLPDRKRCLSGGGRFIGAFVDHPRWWHYRIVSVSGHDRLILGASVDYHGQNVPNHAQVASLSAKHRRSFTVTIGERRRALLEVL